jgi:hypothetical protein
VHSPSPISIPVSEMMDRIFIVYSCCSVI